MIIGNVLRFQSRSVRLLIYGLDRPPKDYFALTVSFFKERMMLYRRSTTSSVVVVDLRYNIILKKKLTDIAKFILWMVRGKSVQ